jgi:chemotaxis protein CheD
LKNEEVGITSVGIGEIGVIRDEGRLAIYGLGSCVGLILYDEKKKIAGMAHILLPGPRSSQDTQSGLPAKYGDEALKVLLENMGYGKSNPPYWLKAGVIGGAKIFSAAEPANTGIGQRNAEGIISCLRSRSITLSWQNTGGEFGRSLAFELPAGKVLIRTLREGWRELE